MVLELSAQAESLGENSGLGGLGGLYRPNREAKRFWRPGLTAARNSSCQVGWGSGAVRVASESRCDRLSLSRSNQIRATLASLPRDPTSVVPVNPSAAPEKWADRHPNHDPDPGHHPADHRQVEAAIAELARKNHRSATNCPETEAVQTYRRRVERLAAQATGQESPGWVALQALHLPRPPETEQKVARTQPTLPSRTTATRRTSSSDDWP